MNSKNNYIKYILLHLLLGVIIYMFRPLSFGYSALILFLGVYSILKNKNNGNEALYWAAYVVAAEVFLRMTKGNIGNEFAKYCVIIFSVLGIYYKGISRKSFVYFFFLLLLVPGLILGGLALSSDAEFRKVVVFNLLGAICLGIASLYLTERRVSFQDFDKLTRWMLYPILAMTVYVFLYNPDIREVVTGTDSNSATSGGYGPNQVSTIFGLGMFLAFARFLLFSKTLPWQIFHLALVALFTFRGVITFSRGGVYTGIAMILFLIIAVYPMISIKGKFKIGLASLLLSVLGVVIFTISIAQTGGLILNRYQGEDALGREKASKFSGREQLAESELTMFIENPIWGIGVGKNKEYREELIGVEAASHNEITRMLAEHGAFGILGLLILFSMPFVFYFTWNRKYLFMIPFFLFWLLTINHAAMRTAAPAFMYALTLLKFDFTSKNNEDENETTLPREQT